MFLFEFRPFFESVLDQCQSIVKLNHQSFMIIILNLTNIDKLVSSHFYGIELNVKCDFDPQICDPVQIPESLLTPVLLPDLSNIFESVLIPIPVIPELESPIFDSHIPSWGNECGLELHFLDLDPLPEPISTLEPLLDLSLFPESVLVPVLPESRSIIPF